MQQRDSQKRFLWTGLMNPKNDGLLSVYCTICRMDLKISWNQAFIFLEIYHSITNSNQPQNTSGQSSEIQIPSSMDCLIQFINLTYQNKVFFRLTTLYLPPGERRNPLHEKHSNYKCKALSYPQMYNSYPLHVKRFAQEALLRL